MKPKRSIKIGNQVSYPGGKKAIVEFIKKHLKYPEVSKDKRKEGIVHLKYDINHKGVVFDCHILNSLGNVYDEEAIRVVKLLKFSVKKQRGLRTIFHKKIKIPFKIPPKKKKNISSIKYQMTSSKTQEKKDNKTNTNYTYTINF